MTHMFLVFDVTNCPPAWNSLKPSGDLCGARGPRSGSLSLCLLHGARHSCTAARQPEQRDSSPSLTDPEHVAATEPMCSTTIRPTDCGAWQQKKTWWRPLQITYYGMCEIKQPRRRTRGETKEKEKNKKTSAARISDVHGESWSCLLSAKASSQPSPSLNGGSDGYSPLFFDGQPLPLSITQARLLPGRRAAVW